MQDNVVALAEQQRRIARMHRQLEAAMANGALPDPSSVVAAAPPGKDGATRGRNLDGSSAGTTELFSAKATAKTLVHEVAHGEGWLVLAGQVAIAVALGSGYERHRSRNANSLSSHKRV